MGRGVGGVRGISLRGDDRVVGMTLARPSTTILTVCEHGHGKRSNIEDYRLTRRGGKGVINIKTTDRNGKVVAIIEVIDKDEIMMITQGGMTVRATLKDVRVIGRSTQGVRLINLKDDDLLTSAVRIEETNNEDGEIGETGEEPES